MRRLVPLLLCAWIVLISSSTTLAGFEQSRTWFSQLPDQTRTEVQTQLALLGYYTALVDGVFGPGTYNALISYQREVGYFQNGFLSNVGLQALQSRAAAVYAEMGMELVEDEEGQAAIVLPRLVLASKSPARGGNNYSTPDGSITLTTIRRFAAYQSFRELFETLSRESRLRQIAYQTYNAERFVVAGRLDGRSFYLMFYNIGDESVGFSVSWTEDQQRLGSTIAVFAASHFLPLRTFRAVEPPPSTIAAPSSQPKTATPGKISEGDITYEAFGSFLVFDDIPDVIGLAGEITDKSPLDFLRALHQRPQATTLVLNSAGGLVSSGLIMAHEVHERGLDTYIFPDMGCYSACAFVFLAGQARKADGELGVHQMWSETPDISSAQTALSEILDAFEQFEVSSEVTSRMLRTPANEMYVFTQEELEAFGINRGQLTSSYSGGSFPSAPQISTASRLDKNR